MSLKYLCLLNIVVFKNTFSVPSILFYLIFIILLIFTDYKMFIDSYYLLLLLITNIFKSSWLLLWTLTSIFLNSHHNKFTGKIVFLFLNKKSYIEHTLNVIKKLSI